MIERYSRPEISSIWSEQSKYQLWLDVEIAALEQIVEDGIAPKSALDDVKAKGGFSIDRILEIEKEVKHDVIAFLTNVKEHVGESARFLHYGMTSSDLLDTCFAIQLKQSTEIILSELSTFKEAIKDLAFRNKDVVCVGRSHGIHAEPITFGLKVATWYAEIERAELRVKAAFEEISTGAISGPVGTFAHLSPKVEQHVCDKFGLKPEPVSTQVISRDRHAALFSSFAILASSIERIAVEVRHLQRTEVREAEENFTKGQKGSSAMPHKRNPILTENATGLCRLIRSWAHSALENVALWHERDISHSSVERVVGPDATILLDFLISRMTSVVKNLKVYPENMQKNLDLTGGLVFSGTLLVALAKEGLSREESYSLVQGHALEVWEAINDGDAKVKGFQERVLGDERIMSVLGKESIDDCFDISRHTKNVDFIFERVFGIR